VVVINGSHRRDDHRIDQRIGNAGEFIDVKLVIFWIKTGCDGVARLEIGADPAKTCPGTLE